jgi:hypothetical protein
MSVFDAAKQKDGVAEQCRRVLLRVWRMNQRTWHS